MSTNLLKAPTFALKKILSSIHLPRMADLNRISRVRQTTITEQVPLQ